MDIPAFLMLTTVGLLLVLLVKLGRSLFTRRKRRQYFPYRPTVTFISQDEWIQQTLDREHK